MDEEECCVLKYGQESPQDGVLIRLHSECLTGDVFDSLRCDCGEQLNISKELIVKEGTGYIFYMRQEGRGIGLFNKIRAYDLQDQGEDTVSANLKLGLPADARNYNLAIDVLRMLGIKSVRLITNNPDKEEALCKAGIVVERIPIQVSPNSHNHNYLLSKKVLMGHDIDLEF